MSQDPAPTRTNLILDAFQALLTEQQQTSRKVITRQAEVEKAKNQDLLTRTAAYTPDTIVNGLATLQLGFSEAIKEQAEFATRRDDAAALTTQQRQRQETDDCYQTERDRTLADIICTHPSKLRTQNSA
ncbi:MAG: hypothetical protein HC910_07270 [Spirulinaceae cyanobacterium SM2_1_0]|nr:hypothetical protein [Spirulinaceae cyanobacterium SM2_1_0]